MLMDFRHGKLRGVRSCVGSIGEDPHAVEGLAKFRVGGQEGGHGGQVALTSGGGIAQGVGLEVRRNVEFIGTERVVHGKSREAELGAIGSFDDQWSVV